MMQETPVVTVVGGALSEQEIGAYVTHVKEHNPHRDLKSLQIKLDGDYVDLSYEFHPVQFERIRRITGYLVGTTDRFNNAKRAEERERVKHQI